MVSEPVTKFMLVVDGNGVHHQFTDQLTGYMAGLTGTSLTHVAVAEQPDPAGPQPSVSPSSVIVEWFAAVPPEPAQWADDLGVGVDQLNWYAVSEALRWQRPGTNRSANGVSHICCVGRATGLNEVQFEQHWTEVHRPLAQKHHFGMELYVQNMVRGLLGSSGLGIDGIAELGFRSEEALRDEMYDSDEGLKIISADVSKFVGRASCGLYRQIAS
jgi:uncharacterized protein (TIGR02118 family)